LTFVGTASSTAECTTASNTTTCGPDFHLTPGSISVAVYWQDGPMVIDPFAPVAEPGPNDRRVMIDGVPAILSAVHPSGLAGGGEEISLELAGPSLTAPPIFVLAELEGPPEEGLVAQVNAVLASVHYEPALHPTASMDAAAAHAAAAAAVGKLTSDASGAGGAGGALPCFQLPGDADRSTVLTEVPYGPTLTKPLPVTCSTAIEGTSVEVWKFVVTISWAAAADRKAGSADILTWVSLDGTAWPFDQTGDQIPYQS
jgi:hypothetical protein